MRTLAIVLAIQFVIGGALLLLVATGKLGGDDDPKSEPASARQVDRFDEDRAWAWLKRQVALGPRPAGSAASRRLAGQLKKALPRGRYQAVPGGLRNVIGTTPGRDPERVVVVGAHYDTKEIKGFVGANDGAGRHGGAGRARPRDQAAHARGRRSCGSPSTARRRPGRATPDFEERGIRGAKVAAKTYKDAESMILLDFIADKRLRIPREGNSDIRLWGKLRSAARRVGASRHFPDDTQGAISDDHIPFIAARGAVDRPDRLRLPLLARDLRRPERRIQGEPGRKRRNGPRAAR